MQLSALEQLIHLLSRLPGLGPRSGRRIALHLLKKRELFLTPLANALATAATEVRTCSACGNFDASDPCAICRDARRDRAALCIVADVADLWALERTGAWRGLYHVLNGELSALDGIGPEQLSIPALIRRVEAGGIREAILALGATVDGQMTAHYLADRLAPFGLTLSRLAHGVPVGGELDYLDDGTLIQALKSRQKVG